MGSEDRYYVVDDPVTRAYGGQSTRFGVVDRQKEPLSGKWCTDGVYSTREGATRRATQLNREYGHE